MAESWADQYLRDANAVARGRVSTIPAATTSPDKQAEYDKLAKRFYVPPSVVENDPERFQRRAAVEDAQRQIDLAPKLGQWLGGDPQRAKMTHDSLDAMAGVEHAISAVFPKNGTDADKLRYWKEHNPGQGSITTPPTTAQVVVAKIRKAMDSLYSSSQTSDVQMYGIAANAMGNLFGDYSAIAQHLRQRAGEKQREAQKYSQANKGGEWEQAIYGGIENLVPALVALGAGVASGGSGSVVVGTAGSLLTAGAMTQGQSYITARQAGLSHEEAQAFGQRDAAVEVATELLPTARIFHALKVGTPAMDKLKDWAVAAIEEQVGEQFATHLQDLNQWASIDANKGKTLDQYFAERPDAAFRTAVATAIMSGTIGGIIGATNLAQRRRAPAEQQAQRSQRTEALLTGLKELAEAAPIAKRDTSTFQSWVKAAAEGTEATDVYIDARTLVETLQQSGLTEPEIVAALPSIRTELPTALLANGDVRIPIEEFAARSGELGQSLIPHLRLDPNDKSVAEAQEFMRTAQEEFQKETEKAFAEVNADDAFRQSAQRVADQLVEKLNSAGRFIPEAHRAYASLHAAFFARLASDLGTTPEEAAARYPLQIQAEGVGEGPGVMDQPQEADEAAAPQIFDQGERAPPALYPAIRHNGKIYKSVSDHLSALSQIPDPAERAKASADGDNRVYVTERGKVLDRFRAQEYAQAHDLISPDAPSWARTSPDLISENLRKPGRYYADTPREGYDQSGQPIFYSALQRTVESSKQAKAPASQWKSILQNAPGVKAEELEWSGILDLFDEDPKRVWTRDELVQLLDAGGIKVDEVVLGDEDWIEQRAQELYDEAEREARDNASEYVDTSHFSEEVEDEDGNTVWQVYGPYADEDSVFDTEEAAEEAVTEYNDREREDALEYFEFDRSFSEFERMARDEQGTQFKDWSSDPSNDTYRELLITLPIGEGRNPDRAPSTHWDQPNVVAHVRFMDKRDASGDRVLFIEEVQSDWHQKGRDQGYEQKVDPAAIEAARQLAEEAEKKLTDAENARTALWLPLAKKAYEDTLRNADEVSASDEEIRRAQNYLAMLNSDSPRERLLAVEPVRIGASVLPEGAEAADAAVGEARRWTILKEREYNAVMNPSGILNAPFKSTWPALVMKRMIRWAVDNGYTKIAWTTGEEQADRYDLAATVGTISAWRNGDEVGVELGNYEAQTAFVGQAGSGPYSREQLVEVLGQDLGNRVFDAGLNATYTEAAELEGDDLKIGGEGMKAFYDRNLVNITNDLIKKYGAKVGKVTLPNPEKVKQWHRTPQPDTPETLAARMAYEADRTNMDAARAYQDALVARNNAAFAAANENGALSDVKHGFEISDKLAEAAAGGFPLFQGPRGQIRVGDVTQDPTVITLLQRADLSTFLHESGHFFLEVLMHVAAQPDAPQRVVDDMNAFLKWTGVESMGQWSKMTINEKRPHHERFARGVEAFLYEGNAPSLELKSLFQRFRGWLLTVYRSLTQLNVELTPEIRGVFNRMLASDQAIREAEQQVGYEPILTEKPEGMADEEWEAYQRLGADATSEAVTDLERRSLRDMRYAGKAAGRELKRLQREIRTMREAMRAEVEADLAREPVYRAQEFMKKGLLDGEPVEGPTKMLISEVEALYEDRPKLYVDEVKRALGYGMLAKDGIHPEQIAELFGFTSADHMIQDLMLAEPFKKAVETEIDTRMLERYGDITSEKALQDAVDQAIHNDVRGRFVATEFAALSKAPGKPRVMAAAARSLAEKAVSRLKVRNLRPAQYEAAERRAAKAAAEASAKGDIALAASEKRNQLINFYGAKASHDALADVDKMVRYFKKFENKGTRQNLDTGYLDQIDKLLERFDLRKSVTNKQADRRKSLSAWVERQREMGFDPLIDEELLDEANRVPYREMTVEEMRGLRDTIKNIEHLARLKKKLLLAKDQRDFADAVNDVAGAIRANAYKNVAEIIGAKSWWERVQSGVRDFFAMHRKMANWAHVMDGNKMGGPVWERFIRPMNERGAWEASAKAKATADLGALFDRLKGQNLNKRSFVPAIGKSLSLQDRLMVALNMGNEGNLQRLMDGERWEQDKLNAVLEPLTQDHWAFVQAVWDYLDSFYPDVAAKEVRVSGVAPQKVEAVPFERQLADGSTVQMRGGYFPIKYDPDRSSKAEADTAAEVLQQMTQGRYTAAQTRRGHTKARAEQVDRPVRKDFGVIFEHVNQVIHDLAWHEYLIDANRLLRAVDIDTAIREAHGPETLRWMRKALEDIAIGEMPARDWLEAAANSLRVGASVSTMAWNFLTALQQPLGLVSAAGRIGPRWVLKGIKNIMGDAVHMENTARWVYERSEVMRNRATTQQREIAEVRNKVSDKSPLRKAIAKTLSIAPGVEGDAVIDAVQNSYFFFITKAQLIADLPTWVGQYEKSMAAGETEDRAAALADQAVLDTQGGGQIKDMAGVQRGPVYLKLFTNFYSFFNATLNMNADRIAQLRREGITDIPAFAADMLLINVLPSVLGTLIYTLLLGDDDDRDIEGFIKKAGGDLIGYMMSQIVGLREFSGLATGGDTTYAGPAGTRFFKETTNLANQVRQGEADEAAFRAANKTAGILFKYPSTAVDRFVRGSAALEQGEAGPLAPVVGPPVDR